MVSKSLQICFQISAVDLVWLIHNEWVSEWWFNAVIMCNIFIVNLNSPAVFDIEL